MATVLTTAAIVLAVLLLFAVAVLWRLYNDGMRRADAAARLVAAERAKADQQQLALRRYEVAFASISGRGELGEQVLRRDGAGAGAARGAPLHPADRPGRRRRGQAGHGAAGGRRPHGAGRRQGEHGHLVRGGGDRQPDERLDALRAHVRQIRSRAAELAGKGYQRWADAIYGTIMFVPSDAAVVAALDTDPELLRWLSTGGCSCAGRPASPCSPRRPCSPRATARSRPTSSRCARERPRRHRAAGSAVDAINLSSTHLQRFLSARRRELEALERFRAAVAPLSEASGSPAPVPPVRKGDELAAS